MKMPSGKTIRSLGKTYSSYIPDPLPPQINWDLTLVNTLSEADRLLGYLAGEGSKLPNPHLLIRPFIAKEAVLSSKIEGTQATLGEVLAVRAGAQDDTNVDDIQEVNNYINSLEYGIKRLQEIPLSLRLIKEIHALLMDGVRGNHATPGAFRISQNWIGPAGCTLSTCTYIPPAPEYLMDCLSDFESFLHDNSLPPLVQIALIHYQFEAIHPFLDGNGRIGRLLITLFLIDRKILSMPLLYLSAFFEATRKEYYARLLAVTQDGDWAGWLEYFLRGVALQAKDATSRAASINNLVDEWHKKTSGISYQLIEKLASNPYITISKASEDLQVQYTTIQRAIGNLENLGIIKEISGKKRNKLYCAQDILNILEAPAELNKE